jgi:hypothetical protein
MALFKSDEELEALVRKFLSRLGMEFQVRPDLMTMITKIKRIDPGFNYGRVPDHEMPTAEAQWDSANRIIWMRDSVFAGMQRGEPRDCMSVAHEIGHYLHNHKGLLNRKSGIRSADIPTAAIRHQESEARRTGAIILAPEYLIPENASVDSIIAKFGLSAEAAIYRFEEVNRIRRRRKGEKRPLPSSIVDYLREAKRRGYVVRTEVGE